jgi:hypothetical protein
VRILKLRDDLPKVKTPYYQESLEHSTAATNHQVSVLVCVSVWSDERGDQSCRIKEQA